MYNSYSINCNFILPILQIIYSMKSIRAILAGLILVAATTREKNRKYSVIIQNQQPKKKAKLQSVKKHKSKPSNKFKGSKPIKVQMKKSNINKKH